MKHRRISLTERAILNGFGVAERRRIFTLRELADRMEISTVAPLPHLQTLIDKGEVVAIIEAGQRDRYRRRVVAEEIVA